MISYGFIMNLLYDFFASKGSVEGYFNTLSIMANTIVLITSILSVYNILFAEKEYPRPPKPLSVLSREKMLTSSP